MEVHYHIHKSSPPVPILSQIKPGCAHQFHFLKIYFNITLPLMPRSCECSYCGLTAYKWILIFVRWEIP